MVQDFMNKQTQGNDVNSQAHSHTAMPRSQAPLRPPLSPPLPSAGAAATPSPAAAAATPVPLSSPQERAEQMKQIEKDLGIAPSLSFLKPKSQVSPEAAERTHAMASSPSPLAAARENETIGQDEKSRRRSWFGFGSKSP